MNAYRTISQTFLVAAGVFVGSASAISLSELKNLHSISNHAITGGVIAGAYGYNGVALSALETVAYAVYNTPKKVKLSTESKPNYINLLTEGAYFLGNFGMRHGVETETGKNLLSYVQIAEGTTGAEIVNPAVKEAVIAGTPAVAIYAAQYFVAQVMTKIGGSTT